MAEDRLADSAVSAVSAVVVLELSLGTVGAINHDLFGFILFGDGQVGAPTARLFLRPCLLAALLAPQHDPTHNGWSAPEVTPQAPERR